MSEQIKQLGGGVVKIGEKFEYFNLGNVTIGALAKNNIIPKKNYGDYNNKRPDGILVDRSNKKDPRVIAVIEYKDPRSFKSDKDIDEAVKQCNNYCQVLGAIFGVATDTNISVWFNPNEENKNNEYADDFGITRSYSYIKDEEKQKLSNNFYFHLQKKDEFNFEKLDDEVKETLKIIKRILDSDIGKNNSDLKDTIFVDPTNLAKSVWQDIYVETGREPEKCLYNVVEIFIFKFLSDLGVLEKRYSFSYLTDLINDKESDEEILKYYAEYIRPKIKKELFPADIEDGTTIMNGTIFVNEKGGPVLNFASLFRSSIEKYNSFGDLTNVEKSFKTKLYEKFLKRGSGVKGMGQFFTPRKVVGNIVEMAKVENLKPGARVCDPFCGVGGFPLEVMAKRNNKDFTVKNGEIIQNIEYFGFDKGSDEKDSERTIILAKANMLIYLADLIKEYPSITNEFSKIFNKTFKLKKGSLGTLSDVGDDEDDKFDLIITNPPYVTKGSARLKDIIEKDQDKKDFYRINGTGIESLAIEWIVNKLKKGGKAFIIVPGGILTRGSEKNIRKFILDNCFLNGIISLPVNTFFTTPQKTYILALTKKDNVVDKQIKSVFTYMVNDIGETLDVDRFDTGNSDLEKAKKLFRMFEGNEFDFETFDRKCKIKNIKDFKENIEKTWDIEKFWTKDEKVDLGIEEQEEIGGIEDFISKITDLKDRLGIIENQIKEFSFDQNKYVSLELGKIVDFSQNTNSSKFTKSFINDNKGDIPVFSASKDEKMIGYGYIKDNMDGIKYFNDCLTWNIDGSIGYVFYRKGKFSLSEKVIPLIFFEEYEKKIDKNYLKYLLQISSKEMGFSYSNKAGKGKIKDIFINFPINNKGEIDIKTQIKIANKYMEIDLIKEELEYLVENIKNLQVII